MYSHCMRKCIWVFMCYTVCYIYMPSLWVWSTLVCTLYLTDYYYSQLHGLMCTYYDYNIMTSGFTTIIRGTYSTSHTPIVNPTTNDNLIIIHISRARWCYKHMGITNLSTSYISHGLSHRSRKISKDVNKL